MSVNFTKNNKETLMDLFHMAVKPPVDCEKINAEELFCKGIIFLTENGEMAKEICVSDSNIAKSVFGISNTTWGRSFHKSWDKVATASEEVLWFEQAEHYFSTYGRELMGLEAMPLVPVEDVLTDPETLPNVKSFTIIKYVSESEAIEQVKRYLAVTVAPHKNKIDAIIKLMLVTDVLPEQIKSSELKIARYDQTDTVPQSGDEFMRYLIYKLTGSTLVIKNKRLIRELSVPSDITQELLEKINEVEMAKVFHRYKPLLLALKKHPGCAPYINRFRRLADKYHKPLSDINVQNVLKLYTTGRYKDARMVLERCSLRQLIKLYNFTLTRELIETQDISNVYNIRNGKLYITQNRSKMPKFALIKAQEEIGRCIQLRCEEKASLKGKVFFIPSYINYAAPYSEKQFIGNIPYGTYVTVEPSEHTVAAVHWKNFNHRTDLDLHLQSMTEAFGWNASYRSDNLTVLYSGDMTDAPGDGAVEAYCISLQENDRYLLTISNYTCESNAPFEFFMTSKGDKFKNRYSYGFSCRNQEPVCDVADALFTPIPLKFDNDDWSQTIGMFHGSKFYFYGGELGADIVPKRELYSEFLKALEAKIENRIDIEAIICLAGGTVIHDLEDYASLSKEIEVIDLSPASLTTRTLLDIVDSDVQ